MTTSAELNDTHMIVLFDKLPMEKEYMLGTIQLYTSMTTNAELNDAHMIVLFDKLPKHHV